jgi:hypothetical protein
MKQEEKGSLGCDRNGARQRGVEKAKDDFPAIYCWFRSAKNLD